MSLYLGTTPIADGTSTALLNKKVNLNLDNSTVITNCITEIPQDIKLELNNGTLTLKAGSKVYKLDGTPITINTDVSLDTSYYGFNQPCLIYYSPLNNSLETPNVNICFSGSDYPTITTYQYMLYFDTTAKTYYWTSDNGTSWTERTSNSYPIAIATIGESSWQSIDQVFNGFGYIGSTVFALPGVKGLIPNGRNTDGTLKNFEHTLSKVWLNNFNPAWGTTLSGHNFYIRLFYNEADIVAQPDTRVIFSGNIPSNFTGEYFNEIDNYWYWYEDGQKISINLMNIIATIVPTITSSTEAKITSFTPKTVFHSLGYNDSSTISGWSMPSSKYIDLTLGASGSTYTAPANGYLCFRKSASANNQYAVLMNNTSNVSTNNYTNSSTSVRLFLPAKKGDTLVVTYNLGGSTDVFRFVYAEGEN